jgi:UDP-N-acetylglucosamine--N-acetylmuramyl-(pentapeptide) pyrophosphoryl-undecaprenol N-acetylglucosamine transferase
VPRLGYPFHSITAEGFRGRGIRRVRALFKAGKGFFESRQILKEISPHLVIGVGGYASLPAGLAAVTLHLPLVIQEQNSIMGWSNRILARWSRKIFLSYQSTLNALGSASDRAEVVGNPVRQSLFSSPDHKGFSLPDHRFNILVMGGSRGARAINRAMVEDASLLEQAKDEIAILHQTGHHDLDWVKEGYSATSLDVEVVPFIENMSAAYHWADVVVCRAGATTLSELTSLGKPAVLIPYPHAAGDHQFYNAQELAKGGAAVVMREEEVKKGSLASIVLELLGDRDRVRSMAERSKAMGRPEAAQEIALWCWQNHAPR